MAWTIADKYDVYSIYKKDISSFEDQWSTFAEALLLKYLGKDSVADITTTTNFVEYKSGTGGRVLLVEYPIDTLNSVTIDDVSYSISDFIVTGREITMKEHNTVPDRYEVFPDGIRNVVIDYDATVPDQEVYKLAVVLMISAIINYEGRKGADADIEWAGIVSRFGSETANQNIGLVSHCNAIMDQLIGKEERVKIR